MKKITSLVSIIIIFLSTNVLFSQKDISSEIIKPFQKDALFREKVFIHLNKSIYFTNENIWFTSYVGVDKTNSPSEFTSNLHVNLLNQQGEVLESKTIFIKNGIGNGDFFVAKDYSSGNYFIQGYTNFMMNFGRENVFLQEIKILNPSENKEKKSKRSINAYDIQLFPESGYLLEDTQNTIGIKALINGKGFPYSGKIINNKGEEIAAFIGNSVGMSSCNFIYSKDETYTALVEINNTIQKIQLPKAKTIGVIFSLDNVTSKDVVKLTLKTNEASIVSLNKDSLALIFYRNNTITEAVTLSLKTIDKTTQELFFDKRKMLHGVNVVTLFRNNQPIAERKFFIDKPTKETAILVKKLKTENDSIHFKISTLNSNFERTQSRLSISILPKEAKSFYENQHIKSAFLLTPYVKGEIENPAYYFQNRNSKTIESLDVLLLNQGWSAYTLKEKIKEINPKKKIDFESGFTINGAIKKIPKGYDIGMLSKNNRLVAFSKFDSNKEFAFENVFAYKNETTKIALIKKGELLVKPSQVRFLEIDKKNENYKFLIPLYREPIQIVKNSQVTISENLDISNFTGYPKMEVLDQIMLKTVVNKKEQTFYDKENELAHKHKVLAPSFYQNKKVTERMETTFQTVFEYFMSLGYIKRTATGRYFISLRNARVTFAGKNMNPDNTYPPKIYLDDTSLNRDGDIEMLKELSMKDIDEVLINKSGAGGGIDGTGGIIKIYRKKGNHKYFEEASENLYEELILLTGFDRANDYYKPQYNIYTEDAYNWSEIDWKSNLQISENGEVFIKVQANEFSNEFQFIINGFSNDGLLFNTIYKTRKEGL